MGSRFACTLPALVLVACTTSSGIGYDAQPLARDAVSTDAETDASDDGFTSDGSPFDVGVDDAPRFDSGPRDSSLPDSAMPDASSPDASSPDASSPDASSPDAAGPDAAVRDAALPDGVGPDAGSDAAIADSGPPDTSPPDTGPTCRDDLPVNGYGIPCFLDSDCTSCEANYCNIPLAGGEGECTQLCTDMPEVCPASHMTCFDLRVFGNPMYQYAFCYAG